MAPICVETHSADEVVAAEARLAAADLETTGVDDTQCCYAQKTATWPSGPDGARWEWTSRPARASSSPTWSSPRPEAAAAPPDPEVIAGSVGTGRAGAEGRL